SEQRHEADRDSWTHEVESLRKNIDDLTIELAGAQSQLSQLRVDNERLADQLTGAHEDRDDARQKQEAATRECEAANQAYAHETRRLFDRSNRDHDDTLDRIESLERQTRDVIDDKKKLSAQP
ncbi:unnamed protein product, partial [Hapterophycus canaliculatus]